MDAAPPHEVEPGAGVRLPYRFPLDWNGLLSFLAPRALPGVEEVVGGA